jgi:3-oxoadipate CoA-transferase alpha subunit
MAMAAETAIAQVSHFEMPWDIEPEVVVTPGIFVQRIVAIVPDAIPALSITA